MKIVGMRVLQVGAHDCTPCKCDSLAALVKCGFFFNALALCIELVFGVQVSRYVALRNVFCLRNYNIKSTMITLLY